ncbi:MAG: RNA polymerase sigma factor [Haliea sp.]|nr:MAG: RNA polymerase sigma factor [Haliea sp.]
MRLVLINLLSESLFSMLRDVVQDLVTAYRDLRRHLAYELRNADDAADIAQSSFERVYAHATAAPSLQAGRGIESPRALLFHTARNLCIDAGRRRLTEAAWLASHTALTADSSAPSAEQVALERQLLARVAGLLEQLPARRRDVFILFKVYGYSREDIAERLGITEAAVAKHVVRATLDCAGALAALAASGEPAPAAEAPARFAGGEAASACDARPLPAARMDNPSLVTEPIGEPFSKSFVPAPPREPRRRMRALGTEAAHAG